MRNEIEFIDLMTNVTLKDYERVFKKILKRTKKVLSIKERLGLSVTFCDNKYIQELNKNYRKKDMPTDVLSFAVEDDMDKELIQEIQRLSSTREIGDIVISYERAVEQANEYNHSIKREVCFLFAHGVLHLLGYDHINRTDEDIMILQKEYSNLNLNIFEYNHKK